MKWVRLKLTTADDCPPDDARAATLAGDACLLPPAIRAGVASRLCYSRPAICRFR